MAHLWMIMMIYGRHNGCIIIGGVYDYDVYNGSINHITIVNGCMVL